MEQVTLDSIVAARKRIGDAIYHSPCPYSLSLSQLCSCQIYCKLDHLQMTGSFKERGARNKLLLLNDQQKKHGVIAASAGNHALGVAYHGKLLGIGITVVMPKWAPLVKVSTCRALGAEVILHGDSYDDARQEAMKIADKTSKTFVHGFDDPAIIAGQGTLGLEILEDVPDVDVVIVGVGGGGLIAGIATAIKSQRPGVKIIGVESANAPTVHDSLQAGRPVKVHSRPTLADGLAFAQVGENCFPIIQKLVYRVMLVNEPQIAQAILWLLELEKTMVEGAGAVPLAAAKDLSKELEGKKVVLVLGGGNIDVTLLGHIIQRGLAADGRLCRIRAFVTDRPGSLAKLTSVLAGAGASILEVQHDRHFGPADVALVTITCVMETRGFDHIDQIKAALSTAAIEFTTDD